MKILVTGSGGQLGSELQAISGDFENLVFVFTDYPELDISNRKSVQQTFKEGSYNFCINCAAYTAVDAAESDRDKADAINVDGSAHLAEACAETSCKLIHISTDFVFDGSSHLPLKESDDTDPINYYGLSKLKGEEIISQKTNKYFIFRTSWLYSSFGKNFVKTMLTLSQSKDELNIIADQIGSPTYAADLARELIELVVEDSDRYGLYHYSNEGVASWYDFTKAIFEYASIDHVQVQPIPTTEFPTPAKRPHYSVMDKRKYRETFGREIPHWRESLKRCLQKL